MKETISGMETNIKPFTILPAGWRDLRAVSRVERECFLDDAWPLLDILAVLTLPGLVRLKAMVGDVMAGFASAEERNGYGWITTIGVIPSYRRRGIARALLAASEAGLRSPRVRLCVRRGNLAAQDLYLQVGYSQVEVWHRYYHGGEDALVMEKNR
jgi:ribosomal protein S18 acetylase RimI-like enzyme